MQGRVHLYEGHSIASVVHGVRTMARLGVRCVLLTNAAGGLEPSWSPGDLMIVTDHLNLTGTSPLIGPNDDSVGPRFPDMTHAYDVTLRELLNEVGGRGEHPACGPASTRGSSGRRTRRPPRCGCCAASARRPSG